MRKVGPSTCSPSLFFTLSWSGEDIKRIRQYCLVLWLRWLALADDLSCLSFLAICLTDTSLQRFSAGSCLIVCGGLCLLSWYPPLLLLYLSTVVFVDFQTALLDRTQDELMPVFSPLWPTCRLWGKGSVSPALMNLETDRSQCSASLWIKPVFVLPK